MKNLSLSEKIIFFVNTLVALIFLVSLIIPFIPPRIFSFLSVIGLFTPILITLNFIFIFFWISKLKKQFFLSLFVLLIGHATLQNFINFSNNFIFIRMFVYMSSICCCSPRVGVLQLKCCFGKIARVGITFKSNYEGNLKMNLEKF